jgi:HAD superfamily hydrolase (TIGR01450 family)
VSAPLVEPYGCVLLDLDGTLFEGEAVVPGAPAVIEQLRAIGKRPVFMTNNSSRTAVAVADKLSLMGFSASPDEVVTSAGVTAALLGSRGMRTAFVVGESGIRESLGDQGIKLVGANGQADCVVVGWDRGATYERLRDACVHVQRGAHLVATNPDPAFPAGDALWPGAGALLAVITTTTGAHAEVVGKPFPAIFEASRAAAGDGRPLVVGDRLDTDIAGAVGLGWDSLLVLSGITSRALLERSKVRPTFVGEDVSALLEPMPQPPSTCS